MKLLRPRGMLTVVFGVLAIAAAMGAGAVLGYVHAAEFTRDGDFYRAAITRCVESRAPSTPVAGDLGELRARLDYCEAYVSKQSQIIDYEIRRTAFVQQRLSTNIILTLVSCITLAGVAMAGVQVLASYQLAAKGVAIGAEASEMTLENGKIAFRSSVTGLMILVVSLIFFFVYVKFVFPITEVSDDPAPAPVASTAPPAEAGPLLKPGNVAGQPVP